MRKIYIYIYVRMRRIYIYIYILRILYINSIIALLLYLVYITYISNVIVEFVAHNLKVWHRWHIYIYIYTHTHTHESRVWIVLKTAHFWQVCRWIWYWMVLFLCFFMFYYNQQMHNYFIKVYTTTVSLCNLLSYMFRHFRVIIRQFTTSTLLSYTRSSKCSCWKYSLWN